MSATTPARKRAADDRPFRKATPEEKASLLDELAWMHVTGNLRPARPDRGGRPAAPPADDDADDLDDEDLDL